MDIQFPLLYLFWHSFTFPFSIWSVLRGRSCRLMRITPELVITTAVSISFLFLSWYRSPLSSKALWRIFASTLSQLMLPTCVWNMLQIIRMLQSSVSLLSFRHLSHLSARQASYTSGREMHHETLHGPYKEVAVVSPPHVPTSSTHCSSSAVPERCFAEPVCFPGFHIKCRSELW